VAIDFNARTLSPRLPELAAPVTEGRSSEGRSSAGATSFADRLGEAVAATDLEQKRAEAASTALAEGRSDDLHGTMIALQRADVSLRLAANVKNRAIEAYREVMRMGG
jgi:flagellar hook-basal body complex protein FliE